MAIVKPSKPYTFIDGPGNTAVGAEVNNNFDVLYSKVGEVIDNINNAAGSKVNLDARLDVALNEDGTQKTALTAGGEWINPGFTATYISATQFSVPDNHTDIYQVGRRVKVGLSASTVYSTITAASFGLGVTTVTVGSVLTDPISSMEHGVITPDNGNSSLPTDFMTTTATANKGVLRDASGDIYGNRVIGEKNGQTDFITAGILSQSLSGDVVISAHASGTSAAILKHVRGGNGFEVLDSVNTLAKLKAAQGVASDDLVTKAQLDGKLSVGSVVGAGTSIYTNAGTVTCTAGQQVTVLDGGGTAYVNQQTLVVFAEVTLARGAAAGNTHAYITAATGGDNLVTQIYSAGQSVAADGTITIQVMGVFYSIGAGTFTPRLSVISSGADSTVSPNGARISARPVVMPAT